jgi:hypothetical protein
VTPPPDGYGAVGLLVDALAVHRIVRLVTEDVIGAPLRDALARRWPPHEHPLGPGYAATCPYCASVHAALLVALTRAPLLRRRAPFLRGLVRALALSGAVSLLHEYAPRGGGWR